MVRNIARCLMWSVLVSVVACRDPRPATGPGEGGPGTGSGSFAYLTLTDGTQVIRWMSPDGKHVEYFRTDKRWVCQKSDDQTKCSPVESVAPRVKLEGGAPPGAAAGSGVLLESCPCVEKVCIPMCVNPDALPGLPDPKAGGAPPKP